MIDRFQLAVSFIGKKLTEFFVNNWQIFKYGVALCYIRVTSSFILHYVNLILGINSTKVMKENIFIFKRHKGCQFFKVS